MKLELGLVRFSTARAARAAGVFRERCVEKDRLVGWDVADRYDGRAYHAGTDPDPGPSVPVRVDVRLTG